MFAKWDLAIRFTPYEWWSKALFNSAISRQNQDLTYILSLIRIIEKAGRAHWGHMNCLRRCLVTRQILLRKGVDLALCIGVKRSEESNELKAHSWLEFQGDPVNDSKETVSTYTKLVGSEHGKQLLKVLKS
ncbi:lasso peptide biosynthesis B2 protein [Alteromonas sp. 5E99-2]|uniref:lasso peptide biosynthesis B2 protein n=1 Tax=Alteromonas sp. 5E99-2 TaxID=2817683 RepID=UPI001A990341|nr:lasso peptide biosynthesis B2 protein [Alteromonas sp. 5E99-2]